MFKSDHEVSSLASCGLSPQISYNSAVRMGTCAIAEVAKSQGITAGLGVWGNRGATILRWESTSLGGESSETAVHSQLRTGMVASPIHSALGLLFTSLLPKNVTAEADDEAFSDVSFDREAETWVARDIDKKRIAQVRRDRCAMSRPATMQTGSGLAPLDF
ncbi:MAG: hypothetical protein EBV49_05530 [Betaproteobacteria bacterium]|nr:hypothetical protein [Betaproteobacteria bacterium]